MSFAIGNIAAQMSLLAAASDHAEVHSTPTPPSIEPDATPLMPNPPPIKAGLPMPTPIKIASESSGPMPPPIKLANESMTPMPPPIKLGMPHPPPIKISMESDQPVPPPIKAGDAMLRQGIIIIGGQPAGLHPAVAAAATGLDGHESADFKQGNDFVIRKHPATQK